MGPKIQAAIDFVENSHTRRDNNKEEKEEVWAAIGDLKDVDKILDNIEGTMVKRNIMMTNDTEGKCVGVIGRESKKGPERKPTKEPHKYG